MRGAQPSTGKQVAAIPIKATSHFYKDDVCDLLLRRMFIASSSTPSVLDNHS